MAFVLTEMARPCVLEQARTTYTYTSSTYQLDYFQLNMPNQPPQESVSWWIDALGGLHTQYSQVKPLFRHSSRGCTS